jgi:hypothetical protein
MSRGPHRAPGHLPPPHEQQHTGGDRAADAVVVAGRNRGGGDSDGMGAAEGRGVVVKSNFLYACVEEKLCVHVKNHILHFFLRDRHTKFYVYYNWFESDKRLSKEHLSEGILRGLRVWAAGLNLFIVSVSNLVCCLCTGCTW